MENIATHLTAILGRLSQAVAAFVAAQLRPPVVVWLGTQAYVAKPQPNQPTTLPSETWHQLTLRINRIAQRFRALYARWQAGTLPPLRPSRAGTQSRRQPQTRLPTERGWIGARIPAAAPCAGTIEYLLYNVPEMQDFVQTVPQAGRLLRPLLRALGLPAPDWLKLPPRPKPIRTPPAKQSPPGEPPPTPDRPLPPNIRAAVRAWKKYDK